MRVFPVPGGPLRRRISPWPLPVITSSTPFLRRWWLLTKRQDEIFLPFWIDKMAVGFIVPSYGLDVVNVEVNYKYLARTWTWGIEDLHHSLLFKAKPFNKGDTQSKSSGLASILVCFSLSSPETKPRHMQSLHQPNSGLIGKLKTDRRRDELVGISSVRGALHVLQAFPRTSDIQSNRSGFFLLPTPHTSDQFIIFHNWSVLFLHYVWLAVCPISK